jgi:hypothetical protein
MRYSTRRREFRIVLNCGVTITIPLVMISKLVAGTPAQLARLKLNRSGGALEQREIDLDISLPGLIREVFGFGEIQQVRAARVRTPKKAAASRANGLKGGRPRKVPAA